MESIKYYDVISLYPFIHKTGTIPLRHPIIITKNFKDISQYESLLKCKVIPPRDLHIPSATSENQWKAIPFVQNMCRNLFTAKMFAH